MRLNVLERFKLLQILPAEGDIATLRIIRKLRESLSFSEAEFVEFGLREQGGMWRWDKSADKDIPAGPKATAIVVEKLKAMEADKQLTLELLPLAERFLAAPEDEDEAEPTKQPATTEHDQQHEPSPNGKPEPVMA